MSVLLCLPQSRPSQNHPIGEDASFLGTALDLAERVLSILV